MWDDVSYMEGNGKESPAGAFSFLLVLVAMVIWVGHLLKNSRLTFITQGSLSLLSGLFAGGALFWWFEAVQKRRIPPSLVAFKYEVYMDLLLPPIIFYAGFGIKKKAFFSNFGAVTTLGVIGTVLTACVLALGAAAALSLIGLDQQSVASSLALGTIFSSTDSVAALQAIDQNSHPQLHALVFGESVVNDACAIVLLRAVQRIQTEAQLNAGTFFEVMANFLRLALLSLLLGFSVGLASAFILKKSFLGRHSTDREISLLAVLGFLSYLGAEHLGLSGVFATFFCGLTMSHYAWHTLSPSAKVVSIYGFRVLSFLAELLLFLSCRLDLWSTSLWHKEIYTKGKMIRQTAALAAWLTVTVPLARALVVAPLITAVNACRPSGAAITRPDGAALCIAGCGRGAVTLALAVNHFLGGKGTGEESSVQSQIIAAACMAAVVVNTVVLGGAIPSILELLIGCGNGENGATGTLETHKSWLFTTNNNNNNGYNPLPREEPQRQRDISSDDVYRGGGGSDHLIHNSSLNGGEHNAADRIERNIISSSREGLHGSEYHDGNSRSTGGRIVGVREVWNKLDRGVLQPFFGGRSQSAYRSPPPSPGRWQGAESAITIFERHRREGFARPPPPPPQPLTVTLQSPFSMEEERMASGLMQELPPGIPESGALGADRKTILEELFSHPGEGGTREELVDDRVALEGLVERAESMRDET